MYSIEFLNLFETFFFMKLNIIYFYYLAFIISYYHIFLDRVGGNLVQSFIFLLLSSKWSQILW